MKPAMVHTPAKARGTLWQDIVKMKHLYILLLPGLLHYLIFRYIPIGGIVVAFKDFDIYKGILGSPWVGMKNFTSFMLSPDFLALIRNTLLLGIYTILFAFPLPIVFAVLLGELRGARFKKTVQTISFLPSMLSLVVICSIVVDLLSPTTGVVNLLLKKLGMEPHYFMTDPRWFRPIYVASEVWSTFGYNAVIYISALSGIDTQLYDAARIDGCGRVKSILHVTLPGLAPTICIMFILNIGNIFRIGPDKVILLYNPMTYSVADIFGSFVYRKGLIEMNYSYAAAAGLFESIVAFVFVVAANTVSKRVTDRSLW